MTVHETYMRRCLDLAVLGEGRVAPNPMVGSVLVHNGRIIGEGYHRQYGQAHAEVNCLASVRAEHRHLISESTLYVSLEPCAHFGKTPPCADLIAEQRIPKVVIGCRDPFAAVSGKGIEKLERAGIEVETGILEEECRHLNKRFFLFHTEHRPYITLKWAQTGDWKIANLLHERGGGSTRLHISSAYANRLVHQWRNQEMAILVGTNTALYDDPELTTRLWPGPSPIRLVVDLHLRLPKSLKLFAGAVPTLVFNLHRHTIEDFSAVPFSLSGVQYYQVTEDVSLVHQLAHALYQLKIQSVLVEGGAQLLQSFIDEGAWDEARVITNEGLLLESGLPAPVLVNRKLVHAETAAADSIRYYVPLPKKP